MRSLLIIPAVLFGGVLAVELAYMASIALAVQMAKVGKR